MLINIISFFFLIILWVLDCLMRINIIYYTFCISLYILISTHQNRSSFFFSHSWCKRDLAIPLGQTCWQKPFILIPFPNPGGAYCRHSIWRDGYRLARPKSNNGFFDVLHFIIGRIKLFFCLLQQYMRTYLKKRVIVQKPFIKSNRHAFWRYKRFENYENVKLFHAHTLIGFSNL